ncbi:MAG: SMI1/KNR4 family protein [Leucobacter sp.]|nr:SMI1/KNR4 family protein [Leucobacter sp.]
MKFEWNPPASEAAIRQAEADYGGPLPEEFVELLRKANGGSTDGNLSILDVEDCVQRNFDYEVPEYLPGYFMIGDDGGGTAILINARDRRIYEVDMGVMDERFVVLSANSLGELLALGTALIERDHLRREDM